MVNIKGLDKARVLHALWHGSHTQGLSFMGLNPDGFSFEHAKEIIEERQKNDQSLYFDYVEGHVIKCNLYGDYFDEFLYDRDCGPGAAQRAIDKLTANEGESRLKTSFDSYANKNMRALRDVLCTMTSSAQGAFMNEQGIIIDPPYYMAYENGYIDKQYTILKLDTLAKFTVKLPSIPAERDSDMFTISPDNTFLPYNICVYMREDDDVLNMPDMGHLGAKHMNDIIELLMYLKQKVINYNNTDPMFNNTIYTHDEYVCVNRDAMGIIKKDKQKPKTTSNDICILEKRIMKEKKIMNKREKLLETLNYFETGKDIFDLLFVVEKDPKHENAFNFIIKDEFESDTIEPGLYNIAVLDDSVCFHRFGVRGSVFMYFSDDEDTLFNKEVEYASTHEGLLQSLKSTKTIIEFIIDLLESSYSNANWDHIEMFKNLKLDFYKR